MGSNPTPCNFKWVHSSTVERRIFNPVAAGSSPVAPACLVFYTRLAELVDAEDSKSFFFFRSLGSNPRTSIRCVAQLVEHSSDKRKVVGSNPAAPRQKASLAQLVERRFSKP